MSAGSRTSFYRRGRLSGLVSTYPQYPRLSPIHGGHFSLARAAAVTTRNADQILHAQLQSGCSVLPSEFKQLRAS